jgi:hypothetical protein
MIKESLPLLSIKLFKKSFLQDEKRQPDIKWKYAGVT